MFKGAFCFRCVLGLFLVVWPPLQVKPRCRPSKRFLSGGGSSWPDRLSAPSRTVIAQEARDGMYDFVWSQNMKTKLIKLCKFFWPHEEMRWVRAVQVRRTPRGYRPVKLIRRKNRVSSNRRRLRKGAGSDEEAPGVKAHVFQAKRRAPDF